MSYVKETWFCGQAAVGAGAGSSTATRTVEETIGAAGGAAGETTGAADGETTGAADGAAGEITAGAAGAAGETTGAAGAAGETAGAAGAAGETAGAPLGAEGGGIEPTAPPPVSKAATSPATGVGAGRWRPPMFNQVWHQPSSAARAKTAESFATKGNRCVTVALNSARPIPLTILRVCWGENYNNNFFWKTTTSFGKQQLLSVL